jgi:hypothetical protein
MPAATTGDGRGRCNGQHCSFGDAQAHQIQVVISRAQVKVITTQITMN